MFEKQAGRLGRLAPVVLMALLLPGCAGGRADDGGDPAPQTRPATETGPPPPQRMPVRAVRVVREDIVETLELTGTAQPWDEFQVSSEIPGRIDVLHVEEGDWVQRGDLLLELDREKRQIELASRQANLARSQVELEFARKRLERGRALLEKGAISESEVDSLDQATQIAEAGVSMASSSVDSIREELRDASITAPAAGRISRKNVSRGETVSPSATLLTVIQIHPLKVATEIAEPYLHKIRPGQKATLVFEAVSPEPQNGTVHFIHSRANPQSGSFPAEIRLENPNHRFQPGMVARVRLQTETLRQALVAPMDAVVDLRGESFVFTVEDGQARRKPVRMLRRVGDRAVLEGLREGEWVVVEGNSNLTDPTPVEVLP